jgi:hypothetical protein
VRVILAKHCPTTGRAFELKRSSQTVKMTNTIDPIKLRGVVKRIFPLAMFLCVVLACANLPENSRRPSNRNTATGSLGTAGNSTNTATSWDYSQFEDEMGRGTVYMATIESRNTINLDFPYSGEQHGSLMLREHPRHGKDIVLKIERGQLLDSEYNDPVVVRFDNDKPLTFSSVGASDHSTESLFLRGNAFSVFSTRLKTAKTVRIQVPIYQGGNQVFTFEVEGFRWAKR